MVTYKEVGKRHAFYFSTLVTIGAFADNTMLTTIILAVILAGVTWHMDAPKLFGVVIALLGPVAASICVNVSHHTWWYAHGMPFLGVPLWLLPLHGIFAHWVVDMYWVVTLKEVRKATLP